MSEVDANLAALEYVDPRSLGCHAEAVARYCVATLRQSRYRVEHRGVPYDDSRLVDAFARRAVPERDLINHAFFW